MNRNNRITILCNIVGKGRTFACSKTIAKFLKNKITHEVLSNYPFSRKDKEIFAKSDLIIALGGDGTTLEANRYIKDYTKTSILPVNFGTLGYMTTVAEDEIINILEDYLKYLTFSKEEKKDYTGVFKQDIRSLLSVKVGKKYFTCLNEFLLVNKDPSKAIAIDIKVNGHKLTKLKASGVILSTPTGSTAYNMSAGGPVISPNVDGMVLNVLSAHALNLKPLVLSRNERVEISTPNSAITVVDGVKIGAFKSVVCAEVAKDKLAFLKSNTENYIEVLKDKLNFGRNNLFD